MTRNPQACFDKLQVATKPVAPMSVGTPARLIDDAYVAQSLDFRSAVAKIVAQHCGGVLPETRWRGNRRLRRPGEFYRPADYPNRPDRRVVRGHDHVASLRVRMGKSRGDAEHRSVRHIGFGEPLFPLGDAAGTGDLGNR